MNNIADSRIKALRDLMKENDISAVIIPQSDPHQSEYLAPHWQVRRWFTGFTGSAGTLVVTRSKALLWIDSRYFIQAERQTEGSEIELMKIALPGTPSINDYITDNLNPGDTVAIDGMLFSVHEYEAMSKAFKTAGIKLNTAFNPAQSLWLDRPQLPVSPILVHETKYAGKSAQQKMNGIRAFMSEHNADAMLISALDEIAWTLNLRSRDVRCNPVLTSYLYILPSTAILFVNPDKINDEVAAYLNKYNIETRPYDDIQSFLTRATQPVIAVDPNTTSTRIIEILGDRAKIVTSPVPLAKAVKNDTQIQGIRQAMVRDGIALVKSFIEIELLVNNGKKIFETTIAEILHKHRSAQDLFFDESFSTIAGYGPHGAIVHYSATPETDIEIGTDSLLLVDSGAQYLDGTTDITRTVIFGEPSERQRRDFTLVLKGNIDLAMAIFPAGTRGTQLDVLAHMPLWKNGLNYLHGTGHGVGHFLNVHEGPHSIRTNEMPTPLEAGMVVTDEPGLYLEGRYGIRCENTLLVVPAMTTEAGKFFTFEPLTLFPFDRKLIDPSMMTQAETDWLNRYHNRVYMTLAPHLNDNEITWLASATAPIN